MANQEAKYLTLFFLTIFASLMVRRVSSKDYKLGVLLPYSYSTLDRAIGVFGANYYAGALSIAVDKVNNDPNLLSGDTLSFVWNNTECNQTKMVQQQHWQIDQGIVGFIGPACHGRKAAKIAAKRNLAVVSYGSQDRTLSNKKIHPNFARTSPSYYKVVHKISEVLESRRYKRVTIVYASNHKWRVLKKYLSTHFRQKNIKIVHRIKVDPFDEKLGSAIHSVEVAMKASSQATVFLLGLGKTREIMDRLQQNLKLMNQNPRHGFVGLLLDQQVLSSNLYRPFKWFFSYVHPHSEERFKRTQQAFKRLLLVTFKQDVEEHWFYKAFKNEVRKRTSEEPFNSKVYRGCSRYLNGRCLFNKSFAMPPYFGAYLYDAVVQFANALHKVTRTGKKPTGTRIINKLKGSRFVGADGLKHSFDENADVVYKYTVRGLKRDSKNRLNMLPLTPKEAQSQNRIIKSFES